MSDLLRIAVPNKGALSGGQRPPYSPRLAIVSAQIARISPWSMRRTGWSSST